MEYELSGTAFLASAVYINPLAIRLEFRSGSDFLRYFFRGAIVEVGYVAAFYAD